MLGRKARRRLAGGELTTSDGSGGWARWAGAIRARPALIAALAAALMLVLAIPFFSMRLGSADAGSDPSSSTTRQAYDLLAQGFGPGYNGPLQLVAQVDGPAQEAAFAKVVAAVAATDGVVRVGPTTVIAGRRRQAGRRDRRRLPAGLAAGRLDDRPAPPASRRGRARRRATAPASTC